MSEQRYNTRQFRNKVVHTVGYIVSAILMMFFAGGMLSDYIVLLGIEWFSASNIGFGVTGIGVLILTWWNERRLDRLFLYQPDVTPIPEATDEDPDDDKDKKAKK